MVVKLSPEEAALLESYATPRIGAPMGWIKRGWVRSVLLPSSVTDPYEGPAAAFVITDDGWYAIRDGYNPRV